jgi:hypothetical protein
MGRPFRRQLLVTPHLGPHPCVIYGLQLRRKRPGRVEREHFAIFIISRHVPDRHDSDETGAPDSGGALNLKASIFEMHIASEQRRALIMVSRIRVDKIWINSVFSLSQ